jgi:hypothetical protein
MSSTSTPSCSPTASLPRSCRGPAVPRGCGRVLAPWPLAVLSRDRADTDLPQRHRPYNACFADDELTGVFDWDLAGPSTPLFELAFIAWNCVPLWRDIGAEVAAERLTVIAASYGEISARQILNAVPDRIQLMLDWIPVVAAGGDEEW